MHQHRHEAGGYRRIEVITGAPRRRRWTADEKAALVAESLRPGINISELARLRGVNRGLLQSWRREAMRDATRGDELFVPLRIEDISLTANTGNALGEPAAAPASSGPVTEPATLEIESACLQVRFSGPIDAAALRLVLAHVVRRA